MKKIICDRCGNKIDESNGIYHIRIIGEGNYVKPVAKNIKMVSNAIMNGEEDYCIDCINEIEATINIKERRTPNESKNLF